MEKKKYTIEEVEALDFRDIYKPRFETDGICYIFADVDAQGCGVTALDWDDDKELDLRGDDIESILQYVCDCLNCIPHPIREDIVVEEVNSYGNACIKLTNGIMLRVRGWGHLTSTYVDYENPDQSVPVKQERCLGHLQDNFALWVADKLDPEFKAENHSQINVIKNEMKNTNNIEFCNLPERTEENWGVAFASDLMKEQMNAAREYAKMWYDEDKERARQCAVDFELGATWGIGVAKEMTVRWLKENFPKTITEFKNLNWEDFINKYAYDIQ